MKTVLRRAAPTVAQRRATFVRRPRDRRGDARGHESRRAAAVDREGVRPALVPREQPTSRLFPRPADGPRLGLRHRRSTPAPSPSMCGVCARRSRTTPLVPHAPRDGLGRRLPVHAVIELARHRRRRDARVRRRASRWDSALLPARASASSRVSRSSPSCSRSPPSSCPGWVMFHMGDDVKILAVAVASALSSRSPPRSSSLASTRQARSGVCATPRQTVRGRRLQRARAEEEGPRELAELARSFNAMAAELRAALRRSPRARRVGEPRPAHADRVAPGDGRGARGRPRGASESTFRRCG